MYIYIYILSTPQFKYVELGRTLRQSLERVPTRAQGSDILSTEFGVSGGDAANITRNTIKLFQTRT